VPTLNGKTNLKIPAGTPAGKIIKIKGEGLPHLSSPAHRGDQYVRVDIEVPAKLHDAERQLLQQYAKLRGEKAQTKKKGFFENLTNSL
ncbi:MAG: DnaJ C-terminal domain-containing protein, partial [Candidatus Omnitrophica bacterium]|nr:DnaJ C-terminal domain-containing protein [Candidatus Omnitrophota bacterium]